MGRIEREKMEGLNSGINTCLQVILDFYCHEKKLAIEVDGDIHKKRPDYDEFRDEFLKSMGITTLRFQNKDVIDSILGVLQTIRKALIN